MVERDNAEKKVKGPSRNMYKGHVDKAKGVGSRVGGGNR